MQTFAFDCIGTHLEIQIESSSSYDEEFSQIKNRLEDFEQKFSRFIEGNWLYHLNTSRSGILNNDARYMLEFALKVARETDGYFDPTVGKRLTELGYGNPKIENRKSKIDENNINYDSPITIHDDYRDIEITGSEVILHGDILLEFGGVGKGYLIDKIQEIIKKSGLQSGILQQIMEGEWCRFSPGEGGVRGGYTEYNPSLLEYARENRKNANSREKDVWSLLRSSQLGYKFHRQKPLGGFIADFYSPDLSLVIEIDGESHIQDLEYDNKRTAHINSLGIHVLRYTNTEIGESLEGVREDVLFWIEKIKNNKEQARVTHPNPPFSGREFDHRYLINFGGDLYGKGNYRVGLENPHNLEEVIGIITLEDHFLACSSGSKRKWGNHHHLIDPHSGASARDVLATYIEVKGNVKNGGMLADSYATALCVMPFHLACETLDRTADIEGVILASDGRIYRSEGSRSELFS